jgi:hypothetical protein
MPGFLGTHRGALALLVASIVVGGLLEWAVTLRERAATVPPGTAAKVQLALGTLAEVTLTRTTGSAPEDRGTKRLIVVSAAAALLLGVLAARRVPSLELPGAGWAWFALGLALVWAGFGLRIWAIVTLGRFFRRVVVVQEDHAVVRTGPYRLVRHRSYALVRTHPRGRVRSADGMTDDVRELSRDDVLDMLLDSFAPSEALLLHLARNYANPEVRSHWDRLLKTEAATMTADEARHLVGVTSDDLLDRYLDRLAAGSYGEFGDDATVRIVAAMRRDHVMTAFLERGKTEAVEEAEYREFEQLVRRNRPLPDEPQEPPA